jgi:hypothetical protein
MCDVGELQFDAVLRLVNVLPHGPELPRGFQLLEDGPVDMEWRQRGAVSLTFRQLAKGKVVVVRRAQDEDTLDVLLVGLQVLVSVRRRRARVGVSWLPWCKLN